MKRIMFLICIVITLVGLSVFAFVNQPKFGKLPKAERLEKIRKSPNYINGSFKNLSYTPVLAEGVSFFAVSKEFLFNKKERLTPIDTIPSSKTDLLNIDLSKDVLVWFGHSSYFIQIDGKRILVDPVFSGSITPLPFGMKAFKGTDVYTTEDIPEIDYLFITHDHWDHLDYETIRKLKPRIKQVICGLGIGEDFEYWGYDKKIIAEKDWNEKIILDNGFTAHTVPARHFSGRGLSRNKTLWVAYVLETPTMKIFLGGDGGYDTHFAKIGKTFGAFDLVVLENGQNNKNWKYIHLMTDEVLQAAQDLKARRILPVHSSKFALANHPWDEPLAKLAALSADTNIQLVTPLIGEQVNLKDTTQTFTKWWENVN